MITQPQHVTKTQSWDGTSTVMHGRRSVVVRNKETTMDWAEHQRIVCAARSLMATRPDLSENTDRARFITEAFFDLYMAYNGQGVALEVSKGIHQPGSDPHLQIKTRGKTRVYTFHLVVSDTQATGAPGLENRFQWQPIAFTLVDFKTTVEQGRRTETKVTYTWPLNAGRAVVTRGRGSSISTPDLQAHVARHLAAQAQIQAAARAQAAAALTQDFDAAFAKFKTDQKLQGGTPDLLKVNLDNVKAGKARILVRGRRGNQFMKYDKASNSFVVVQ